ncbi:hypothetical protein D3C71_1571560 [compost metagenome]
MLVEHLLEPGHWHGHQLAAGQLGQAIEVQQLVLRKQHQQSADFVIEQDCLDARCRRQQRVLGHFAVGNTQLFQQ